MKQLQIGFIDFSREERNKVLATLRMLGTQTALDELGIGVIEQLWVPRTTYQCGGNGGKTKTDIVF